LCLFVQRPGAGGGLAGPGQNRGAVKVKLGGDLREVTRKIRPDLDLTVPGLRENWRVGDHSMHHPSQATDRRPFQKG
jgi:hypothetical protein